MDAPPVLHRFSTRAWHEIDLEDTGMAIEALPDWAKGAPFIGPVLRATPANPFEQTRPLCATCPVGQWYRSDVGLQCFCTAFRTEMFGRNLPIVLACDAYEYALLEAAPAEKGDAGQHP